MTSPQRLLKDQDRDEVRRRLEALTSPVTIRLFTQSSAASMLVPGRECQGCAPTEQLLNEVAELSDKITLETVDFNTNAAEVLKYGIERIPCILIGDGERFPFRYYGLPVGYEFATLLEAILLTSEGESPLTPENRKDVQRIDQDVNIKVFVTPT